MKFHTTFDVEEARELLNNCAWTNALGITISHRGDRFVDASPELAKELLESEDAFLGMTKTDNAVVIDGHEIMVALFSEGFEAEAREAMFEQYKQALIESEGRYEPDSKAVELANFLNVNKPPVMGFKFIPFNETTDAHFRSSGWEGKADFLKELGYTEEELKETSYPMSAEERNNFPDSITGDEFDKMWKLSRSSFSYLPQYIAGSPDLRIYAMESVRDWFEEAGFYDNLGDNDKLEEALNAIE